MKKSKKFALAVAITSLVTIIVKDKKRKKEEVSQKEEK